MNTKSVFLCSLALAVYALAPCAAQQLPVSPTPLGNPPAASTDAGSSSSVNEGGDLLPSNWIRYSQPECCNYTGCNGPIKSELYYRTGATFPMGGGDLPRRFNSAGFMLEGGGRVLFFNPARTGAWNIDLGISFFSDASDSTDTIPLNIFVNQTPVGAPPPPTIVRRDIDVTINSVYRTAADLALGREFYLWAPADQPGSKWRVGLDIGGRIGVVKAEFNEIEHRTDNLWGAFVAAHSDWEFPCGSCVWIAGVRAEWSYTWTGILQFQNNSDIGDMSVLLNFGVRF